MFRFPRQRWEQSQRHRILLGLLLALALGAWMRVGLPTAQAESSTPVEDVSAVFASIERAWSQGDADAIVERFGARKVLLRLPDSSHSSRRYSHQQSLLILSDHFATHEIRRFDFVRTHTPETERGKAIGMAAVTWRARGAGRTKESRVLMVLEKEGHDWVITEVQAVP